MRRFLLGLILGLLVIPVVALLYFYVGHPPVAVSDPAFPFEAAIVHVPLEARIDREAPKSSPLEASPQNLEMGAHLYRDQCASCHGLYGRPSSWGLAMYPHAPQLWQPHKNGVVGVSDDPPGETYWKIDNGIRLTGMPSFRKSLNSTEMWQVTLLLANADKPLPSSVMDLLKQPLVPAAAEAPPNTTPTAPQTK